MVSQFFFILEMLVNCGQMAGGSRCYFACNLIRAKITLFQRGLGPAPKNNGIPSVTIIHTLDLAFLWLFHQHQCLCQSPDDTLIDRGIPVLSQFFGVLFSFDFAVALQEVHHPGVVRLEKMFETPERVSCTVFAGLSFHFINISITVQHIALVSMECKYMVCQISPLPATFK